MFTRLLQHVHLDRNSDSVLILEVVECVCVCVPHMCVCLFVHVFFMCLFVCMCV